MRPKNNSRTDNPPLPADHSVVPAGPAGDANANADNVAGESTLVLAGNLVEATAAALPEVPPE